MPVIIACIGRRDIRENGPGMVSHGADGHGGLSRVFFKNVQVLSGPECSGDLTGFLL